MHPNELSALAKTVDMIQGEKREPIGIIVLSDYGFSIVTWPALKTEARMNYSTAIQMFLSEHKMDLKRSVAHTIPFESITEPTKN